MILELHCVFYIFPQVCLFDWIVEWQRSFLFTVTHLFVRRVSSRFHENYPNLFLYRPHLRRSSGFVTYTYIAYSCDFDNLCICIKTNDAISTACMRASDHLNVRICPWIQNFQRDVHAFLYYVQSHVNSSFHIFYSCHLDLNGQYSIWSQYFSSAWFITPQNISSTRCM